MTDTDGGGLISQEPETNQPEPEHLSVLLQRVRDDETRLGYVTKEHLVNIAEYLLSWRGKFEGQEYSEAIRILAKYRLTKLANIHPRYIKQSWKLVNAELAKPYVGRCMRCGLPISNPVSLETGHGPVCRRKLGIGAQKRTKVLPQAEVRASPISLGLKVNSEYEKLLPKLQPKEYEALKDSIRTEGQHFPLIVNAEGVVLDGHQRLRVCRELGLEPKTKVKTFPNVLLEKKFVIESNLRRRHLNNFQKAELALPLLEVERELAKQRQTAGISLQSQYKFPPNEGKVSQDLLNTKKHDRESAAIVAKNAGLSSTTFQRAVRVIERGSEQLKEKTRSGKMSISFAHKQVIQRENHRVHPAITTNDEAEYGSEPLAVIEQQDLSSEEVRDFKRIASFGPRPVSLKTLFLDILHRYHQSIKGVKK